MKVKVNAVHNFEIELTEDLVFLSGQEIQPDICTLSQNHSHAIYDKKSYNIEVIEVSHEDNSCQVKVNGNIYAVQLEDPYNALLKQLGMDSVQGNKIKDVKAPMPGLVLNVLVAEGAEVKKGDSLLILEAMKMENVLKSPAEGTIKRILIGKGDKVEKNQILIEFS